jgi:hypothetical protein
MKLQATFEVTNWEESPVNEWDGGKLTRAAVTKKFAGDIEGDAALEYVMAYAPDGSAAFVGIERVTGAAGGHTGALVLQQVGTFADGVVNATVSVVGGSGDFEGAGGTGEMVADPSGRVTLDVDLA